MAPYKLLSSLLLLLNQEMPKFGSTSRGELSITNDGGQLSSFICTHRHQMAAISNSGTITNYFITDQAEHASHNFSPQGLKKPSWSTMIHMDPDRGDSCLLAELRLNTVRR